MRLTQRKANHVYFWDTLAWALAIRFLILQPVICVHFQWVTAPTFWPVFAFSITVQLCAILMCSLSLPLASYEPCPYDCTCLREGQWSQSHKSLDTYVFPVKPGIFPRTQSLAKGLASVGQLALFSHHQRCQGVATGNISFFEIYSWQQQHLLDQGAKNMLCFGCFFVSLECFFHNLNFS